MGNYYFEMRTNQFKWNDVHSIYSTSEVLYISLLSRGIALAMATTVYCRVLAHTWVEWVGVLGEQRRVIAGLLHPLTLPDVRSPVSEIGIYGAVLQWMLKSVSTEATHSHTNPSQLHIEHNCRTRISAPNWLHVLDRSLKCIEYLQNRTNVFGIAQLFRVYSCNYYHLVDWPTRA